MNDNIKRLQAKIEAEQKKVQNCSHKFGEATYNPYIRKEPYGFKTVGHGSDVWTEPAGYMDVKKDRWTRVCTICGKEEHTDKKVAVVSNYKPDFT